MAVPCKIKFGETLYEGYAIKATRRPIVVWMQEGRLSIRRTFSPGDTPEDVLVPIRNHISINTVTEAGMQEAQELAQLIADLSGAQIQE